MTKLKTFITDDCIADFSTVGHMEGKEQIGEGLRWPGPALDIRRSTIWNFVARSKAALGQQSAYVQNIFALDDGKHVFPFVFGGQFCNTFRKEDGEWKISHIRFDLMYESGNNSFVRDKWKLMDYGIFYGHTPMINAELDAPWYVIPEDEEPQSDAEQIFDLQWKKTFGIDGGDWHLTSSAVTDDMFQNFASHKNVNKYNPTQTDGDYHGKKDFNNFLKAKQHKEARLQHTDSMADLVINGDHAVAYMFRSEFQRTKSRIYNRETIHANVSTALHIMHCRREDGEWKICKLSYIPVLEFKQLDDDCLTYDDYVCGGKKWAEIIAKW